MRLPWFGNWTARRGVVVAALVAGAVCWVAYDNGSYGLQSRNTLAIALWWGAIVAVVFGLAGREPLSRASLVVAALLATFALWTLASLIWTSDAEATFDEFNRVSLYLATFALVTLAVPRRTVGRWADGLAVAVAAIAVVALTSRLLPGSFPEGDLPTFLPGAVTRLSFPLGYWNGLAIFLGLGVPLLLRVALDARSLAVRSLALVPTPVIAAAIYLTSSRGGFLTALIGSLVFIGLTERRWTAVAALAVSLAGGAASVAVLLGRDELVDGPLGTDLVERQGRSAAVLIAVVCLGTGALFAVGERLLSGRVRPSRRFGRVLVVVAAVAALVVLVASDPVQRFDDFKTPRGELTEVEQGDFVQQHLLSGSGSGRWQFWTAATEQWREFPLFGEGAGSYEAWWAEHASITLFVRDAHSLYLESLGELGVVGLALIVALAVGGVAVGFTRARTASGEERVTLAALVAVFTAYVAAASLDWVWELTAVTVVAVAALALVCASESSNRPGLHVVAEAAPGRRSRGSFGVGAAALLAGWILIVAQAIPLLAHWELAASRNAVERGDLGEALSAAEAARDIQPWAATPYLQRALVSEESGDLARAQGSIGDALERDPRDWRLWLVAARIQTKQGDIPAAQRSLLRAVELNPRSPLFAGLR